MVSVKEVWGNVGTSLGQLLAYCMPLRGHRLAPWGTLPGDAWVAEVMYLILDNFNLGNGVNISPLPAIY